MKFAMARGELALDEFGRIARYFAPLAVGEPGALGLLDDAAVLSVGEGERLVVTMDALISSIHFLPSDSPRDIARKALRVNLSDLASMGAVCRYYTLALAIPKSWNAEAVEAWLAEFTAGLAADQAQFKISLVGGDSVATDGPLSISITAMGTVNGDAYLPRGGASVGDDIWVSGTIGDAALGLVALSEQWPGLDAAAREALITRYRIPEPRLSLGAGLIGHASAAMDVSDGLMQDLGHVARASGLGAQVEFDRVPLSVAGRAVVTLVGEEDARQHVLGGGDDYELLFTAPVTEREAIARISAVQDVPVCRIGCMIDGQDVIALDHDGEPIALRRTGYAHA